jgi:hypothetical protein
MPGSLPNPYPDDRIEHDLWERWHRAFFHQPVHAQFYEIESQLRQVLNDLLGMSECISSADHRTSLRAYLLKLQETALLVDEAAEHAYQQVVFAQPKPSDGSDSADGEESA